MLYVMGDHQRRFPSDRGGGSIVLVVVERLPETIAVQAVQLGLHGQAFADVPVGLDPGGVVLVADPPVVDVVVACHQFSGRLSVDQRYPEVPHGLLVALIVSAC